ncbi:MAG: thiamine-phosphate kinase [Sphingomicrobium sp.]
MREREIIAQLRRVATDPAARGLADDVAVLGDLVISHDTIAEGVHFFSFDPPASVGWKLVAVNLSDLAAKGAEPMVALLSLSISGDGRWESDFIGGIEAACLAYGLKLVGGDTIGLPAGAPRVLGMTVIGRNAGHIPNRSGGSAGDRLWLIGEVGNSAAGLAQLTRDRTSTSNLVEIYRRPVPLLAAGKALAPHASAMMDVSDGLLIDTLRLAEASAASAAIALEVIDLGEEFVEARGDSLEARLFAATGGDDYALLAALPPECDPATLNLPAAIKMQCIGSLEPGPPALSLTFHGAAVPLPEALGHEHHGHLAAPTGDRA